jgi:putative transcriptional regulator
MIRLRALELLAEQGKTKYMLNKELGMNYGNFKKMVSNETRSLSYDNIENMCIFFNVTPNELFEWDFER